MKNPNNCSTCEHRQTALRSPEDEGWCYMFRRPPNEVCMQHTERSRAGNSAFMACIALAALGRRQRG